MVKFQFYKISIWPLFAVLFVSTPIRSSAVEDLYNEAINLQKASSYMRAYETFQKIEKINPRKAVSTKALYHLGCIAYKMKWHDQSAVYFFKANQRSIYISNKKHKQALKYLRNLKQKNKISKTTVLQDYYTAHSDDQWMGVFIIKDIGVLTHAPHMIKLAHLQFNKSLFIPAQDCNTLNPMGLHLKTNMSYNDFRNSILNAGLTIVREF